MGHKVDLDHIYTNIVGGFGKWQAKVVFIVAVAWLVAHVVLYLNVFTTFTPDHRCHIKECDFAGSKINESFVEFAVPLRRKINNYLKEENLIEPCIRHVMKSDGQICHETHFHANKTLECDSYVWDQTYWTESIGTINNLVCDKDNIKRLTGTVLLSGLLFGSIIGGKFGDAFGRKLALQLSMVLVTLIVFIMGFVTNFMIYLCFYFCMCLAIVTIWVCGFPLAVEFVDPGHRNIVVSILDVPIASLFTALLAHFTRHWAWLHWFSGGFCLLLLPVIFFIPESPRWLVSKGRLDEALEILKQVAKMNDRSIEAKDESSLMTMLQEIKSQTEEEGLSSIHMFKSGYLSRTLILFLAWSMASLGTYGLTFGSSRLSGDLVMNYFLIMLVDLLVAPFAYISISTIGRPKSLALACFFLGVPSVIIAFMSKSYTGLILGLYIFGKFGSGVAFILVYTITTEIYPTNMRSQALGTCSMVARIMSLGTSYISKLSEIWGPLPMLVLGAPTIIIGCLSLFLPESKGINLPQNYEEGLDLTKLKKKNEETHL